MKLVLLGTSGYHPNDLRHTACMFLPEVGVVLDAGSAMYRLQHLLATDHLDIFLSHAHLDHVVGLTYLLDTVPEDMLDRVIVHGESHKLSAVRDHLFHEALFPVPPPFRLEPLHNSVTLAQNGRLTYFPLKHPGGSIGFRLDWPGSSMAYVTDTTAASDAAYIDKIRGVDLLVHEAYCTDDQAELAVLTGHSSLTPVAQIAAEAQVGRLVLVHINPAGLHDEKLNLHSIGSIFPNTKIGTDGMEIEF